MNVNQQVPIIGREPSQQTDSSRPLIDLSAYESKIRKDIANLAQGILQTHACTAESAFRAAEDFYRIKDVYIRTGEIPAEPEPATMTAEEFLAIAEARNAESPGA